MTRRLLIDLAACLALLGWCDYQPPQRAYGVVLSRECEWCGKPWGCPVNTYRYRVRIQTAEGRVVRIRVSRDHLQGLAYGDLVGGEIDHDHR